MSRCACVRLTLRALGAGRAFIAIDPTSDVSMVALRAPHERPQPSRSFEPAGPSPRRMNPVKGTYCLEPRRLQSCSDTQKRKRVHVVCFIADLECSVKSMAYRFTLPPPRARVSVLVACSGLRSADADRDMSDRLLPPNLPAYLHPRSWLSSYLSTSGMSPGARWIEGHDVSRRRRPLPPDRTVRPRVFAEAASCDRASDTPVARSWDAPPLQTTPSPLARAKTAFAPAP